MCPNCGSKDMWDDNMHGGCNRCGWCSLAGLNRTRTPSNPYDRYEVEHRPRDYDRAAAERAAERIRQERAQQ